MKQTGIRRKRVDTNGEWEYECSSCENWLPQQKFRGCVNYVDAYGNCLVCSSCRAKHSKKKQMDDDELNAKLVLEMIGFYQYASSEEWFKAKLKQHKKWYLPLVKNLNQIEHTDIFNVSGETKKELIESGAELLWEQCRLTAKITGENLGVVLSKSLGNLELKVQELQDKEEYELCYYLNEVIWLTTSKAQQVRNDKPTI
jgi:hypothetical protein